VTGVVDQQHHGSISPNKRGKLQSCLLVEGFFVLRPGHRSSTTPVDPLREVNKQQKIDPTGGRRRKRKLQTTTPKSLISQIHKKARQAMPLSVHHPNASA
jgi:hypothetical protein